MAEITKERIAELRAAWAADRQSRREEFKRDWPMHLCEVIRHAGLGFILGLSITLVLLQKLGGF